MATAIALDKCLHNAFFVDRKLIFIKERKSIASFVGAFVAAMSSWFGSNKPELPKAAKFSIIEDITITPYMN